jgi:hypothetical protein
MCQFQSINFNVSIHNCSFHHTYTHDSKAVKQNVCTNFNRTERHAPVLHPIASLPNTIYLRNLFSHVRWQFHVIIQSSILLLLSASSSSPSFNSLNNRPIYTKRCMDIMPLRTAVTFQKIETCEILRHCCHLYKCSENVYDKNLRNTQKYLCTLQDNMATVLFCFASRQMATTDAPHQLRTSDVL